MEKPQTSAILYAAWAPKSLNTLKDFQTLKLTIHNNIFINLLQVLERRKKQKTK